MYTLPPLFPRQLSFTTLLDLSERQAKVEEIPSPDGATLNTCPRVAIIGAGITGVASAAHILDAGFDCHIFEAGDERGIGGVWTRVNATSSLQIHSSFYLFHPSVTFQNDYPKQGEILGQVKKLWNRYDLSKRSSFRTRVNNVYREGSKWVVNDPSNGYFDGIISAIGTCGDLHTPEIPQQDVFEGNILHSTALATQDMKNKSVLIVGGGASAVEALEYACDRGAKTVKVLVRSEKWFLPRMPWLNATLASTIGDKYGIFARVLEFGLRNLFYGDLWELAPPHNTQTDGIYGGTPVCNSRLFELVRAGKAEWLRGDVQHFTPQGIEFNRRACGTTHGDVGTITHEDGDVCILATGFRRPQLSFLPKSESSKRYNAPNWYLQCFNPEDASILATNCTWKDGIGTVGGGHIGVYTRFLLVFLMDSRTKPSQWMMKTWIDVVYLCKKPCPGGALAFVTSAELFFWMIFLILLQPALWGYASFILMGPSVAAGPTAAKTSSTPALASSEPTKVAIRA